MLLARMSRRFAPAGSAGLALPLAALLGLGAASGVHAAAGHGGAVSIAGNVAVQGSVAVAGHGEGRRRDGGRGRRSRDHHTARPYRSLGWSIGLGLFGPWAWPPPYPYYGVGPWGWEAEVFAYAPPDAGALDINTRPKKASVYVDGELVGRADAFDGFPRYLWLRGGSYRIAVFKEGYETLERRIRVRPGVVIRIDDDLVPGTAAQPQPMPPEPTPAPPAPDGESWRVENRGRPLQQDLRRNPARLTIEVEPADAVVYLDGRLLGSGAELASLHSALIVDPGAHRLDVTRPGYASEVRAFEAAAEEEVTLRIVLGQE